MNTRIGLNTHFKGRQNIQSLDYHILLTNNRSEKSNIVVELDNRKERPTSTQTLTRIPVIAAAKIRFRASV